VNHEWRKIGALSENIRGGLFWSGDYGLTLLTISVAMIVFVITPLRGTGLPGRVVFDLIVVTLMLSAAFNLKGNQIFKVCLIVVIFATAIVLTVARIHPTFVLNVTASFLVLVMLILYIQVVILVMFRAGPITWSRIQGGICAYLLLGMAWASAYQLAEQLLPGSFNFVSKPNGVDELTSKITYYSFCTLTTLGSEITPVHPFVRSLTIAEAVMGQLFPAIFIGALVSLAIQSRSNHG